MELNRLRQKISLFMGSGLQNACHDKKTLKFQKQLSITKTKAGKTSKR